MNRPETTSTLSEMVEKYINPHKDPRIYWAKEVTFDYSTAHAIRVDYMKFKPVNNTVSGIEKGDFYCYEVSHRSMISTARTVTISSETSTTM